jgi:fatty acid desaturase
MSASSIYGCGASRALSLTRKDLSPVLRAEIRRLERLEPARNLRLLLLVPMTLAGGAAVEYGGHPAVRAAGTLVLAVVMMALSVIMHEGIHHLLTRSRRWNRALAIACGLPILLSADAYRALHLRHHAFERTDRDPDDMERLARRGLSMVLVYYGLLVVGTYLYFPHVAVEGYRAGRSRADRMAVLFEYGLILALLGLALWRAPHAVVHLWLLPMMVAAQLTNIRSLAEHGLTTSGNPFTATRSVRTSPLLAFFLCNLNLHLEHHLFPGVPWYNLPAVHRLLQPAYRATGASVYNGYGSFLHDFLRTTWAGVIPDLRMLPAHIREDLCG